MFYIYIFLLNLWLTIMTLHTKIYITDNKIIIFYI